MATSRKRKKPARREPAVKMPAANETRPAYLVAAVHTGEPLEALYADYLAREPTLHPERGRVEQSDFWRNLRAWQRGRRGALPKRDARRGRHDIPAQRHLSPFSGKRGKVA